MARFAAASTSGRSSTSTNLSMIARYRAAGALDSRMRCASPLSAFRHTTGAGPERPPVGSIAPCREKLVFGALNRTIEADESGQEWKQSHQRPDQGQPLAIVAAVTQAPKVMMPTEISSDTTLSMVGCSSRLCRPPSGKIAQPDERNGTPRSK
jgi:hypothetical protein